MKPATMIYSTNYRKNHTLRAWLKRTVMVLLILGMWIVIGYQVMTPSTTCYECSSETRLSQGDTIPVRLINDPKDVEVSRGPFEELCATYSSLSEADCQAAQRQQHTEKIQDLNVVTGAPGSGNDWVLWLGAINDASLNYRHLQGACDMYEARRRQKDDGSLASRCLFMKTHDPWWDDGFKKSDPLLGNKLALILRHPIESTLSEYKRQITTGAPMESKNSTTGITLDHFFINDTEKVTSKWGNYTKQHVTRWLRHARFWLQQYKGPKPYIIIYKDFVDDTRNSLASLLMFFNMTQTEPNLKRSCCSARYPVNANLKRGAAPIDQYRSLLFERTPGFLEAAGEAVNEVNKILKLNYPELSLAVKRG